MTRQRLQYLSACVTDMRATVGALPASFDSIEAFCAAFDEMRFIRNLGEELACAIDQHAVSPTGDRRDTPDTGEQALQTDVRTELDAVNAALAEVREALAELPHRFESSEQFNATWVRVYDLYDVVDGLSSMLTCAPPTDSIA
jgi:hypothetical protein